MIINNFLNNIVFKNRGIACFSDTAILLKTDDLGLIQTAKTINTPTAKTYTYSIDGADGDIDITENLTGSVQFENVTNTYEYVIDGKNKNAISDKVKNLLHGVKCYLIDCDDLNYYYKARLSVNVINNVSYNQITISVDCEPYRYKSNMDIKINADYEGETGITFNLISGKKVVCPLFSSTKEHEITFKGITYTVPDNSENVMFPDFRLTQGENEVTVVKTECETSALKTWGQIANTKTVNEVIDLYVDCDAMAEVDVNAISSGEIWEAISKAKRWCDLRYKVSTEDEEITGNLQIIYEWGDL